MSTKKYKLKELKVKSFVSHMDEGQKKGSRGGFYHVKDFQRIDFSFKRFTEHKTQLFEVSPRQLPLIKPGNGEK